jgi:transglutaminase-like putative cysteine protease
MVRPREGHDIQILESRLEVTPAYRIQWSQDVYGNNIALINFTAPASELMIHSDLILQHLETNPFDFFLEPEAVSYPFSYDPQTMLELSGLLQLVYPEDAQAVRDWLTGFWYPGQRMDTLALLQGMNGAIKYGFQYQIRNEPGVQSPAETLRMKSGSCRDYATLFIEACRCLGLASRFVSGYLLGGMVGGGSSTHAWAEVYLPGGGWKGFDPTMGLLTDFQHVPVAVSRHPEKAMPVTGSFLGNGLPLGIEVDVRVEKIG